MLKVGGRGTIEAHSPRFIIPHVRSCAVDNVRGRSCSWVVVFIHGRLCSFTGSHVRSWVVVFVCRRSCSFAGGRVHLQVFVSSCSCAGARVCSWVFMFLLWWAVGSSQPFALRCWSGRCGRCAMLSGCWQACWGGGNGLL